MDLVARDKLTARWRAKQTITGLDINIKRNEREWRKRENWKPRKPVEFIMGKGDFCIYIHIYIKKERGGGGGYAWEISSVSMELNLTVENFVNFEPLHPKALDCMKIHIEKSH